jgi:hypothetical protein
LTKVGAQGGRISALATSRHNITDQALVATAILSNYHRCLGNRGMTDQRCLNLAGLDAEAPDLDLLVCAAQEVKHALGAPPSQVAGPVHPAARRSKRVGHKTLRTQGRSLQVSARELNASHVELPCDSSRRRFKISIQYIDPSVPNRTANRRQERPLGRILRKSIGRNDVSFAWTIMIVNSSIRPTSAELLNVRT